MGLVHVIDCARASVMMKMGIRTIEWQLSTQASMHVANFSLASATPDQPQLPYQMITKRNYIIIIIQRGVVKNRLVA
jgi:hypothetical protein